MTPVLLLLISAALSSESVASSENSSGLVFRVAFPENIAYYHPSLIQNKIQIIGLYNNTQVVITSPALNDTITVSAGNTETVNYESELELKNSKISQNTLQITTDQNVCVHAISLKNTSMQTALIIPNDKLGMKYFIPPIPTIKGTTDIVNEAVTERQHFKIIIVNAGEANTVTVEAKDSEVIQLEPNQVAHVFIKDDSYRKVSALRPLAVAFGHTCAMRKNCTCGLLYTLLPPATEEKLKFFIPPALVEGAEGETVVLLSDGGSTKVETYNPNKPMVEIAGTAVLYRPGILLNLIPKSDFATCFAIYTVADAENFATIVVHKNHTDGVHVGTSLVTLQWTPLGANYASLKVPLTKTKNIIWHSTSKMAVYYWGSKGDTLFGNPAPVISKTPDYSGCVLTPEVIHIGNKADGWRESLQYCKDQDQDLELISFSDADHQEQIYNKINQIRDSSLWRVWIGMRRRSLTREWYWQSQIPVNSTNWAEGEPGTEQEGQCAIMRADGSKDFGWSDEDCCADAHPVCYRPPTLLPLE